MATDNEKKTEQSSNVKRMGTYEAAFLASVERCSTLSYARDLGAKDGASAVASVLRKGRKGEHRAGLAALMLADIPVVESLPESSDESKQN